MRERLRRALAGLHWLEDAVLAAALGALLLLALAQIALRLVGAGGLEWGETISRVGVLWVAMLGALGAARQQRHIAIDAIPRLLSPIAWRVVHGLGQLGAAGICGWAAWLGWGLVQSEREYPLPFVGGIESWVPMLILPLGFGLLALRFVVGMAAARPDEATAP
jgi:TRAP-type C4-dicarboxylate transport system permease small subunit